jgi:hypothetical protein
MIAILLAIIAVGIVCIVLGITSFRQDAIKETRRQRDGNQ